MRFHRAAGWFGLLLIFVAIHSLTLRVVVEGNSMAPTVTAGDFLLVQRPLAAYDRGDVVVFRTPADSTQDYVKRVIGLPGESVELRDQRVYINGQLLEEPYITAACHPARCADGFWQVGADSYFVMGDNRSFSRDSRAFGAIQADWIMGRVIARYWPFSHMSWIQ